MPFENSLNLRVAEKHDDGVTLALNSSEFAVSMRASVGPRRLRGAGRRATAPRYESEPHMKRDSVDQTDGKVAIVGHSAGCAIGYAAVDARPDRVARVLYVGSYSKTISTPSGWISMTRGNAPREHASSPTGFRASPRICST